MSRTARRARSLFGGTGRIRGAFTRWGRPADAVLAAVMFSLTTFVEDAPGDAVAIRSVGDIPVVALCVFAVASAALFWRRRAPLRVLGVALAAWAVLLGSGYADLGPVTIVALYSAGRHAPDDRWGPVGVAVAIAVVNLEGLTDPAPWGEAVFGGVVMFGAWYLGRRLRLRSERAAQLLLEQAAEANRVVAEERTRIARELHDVVAHRVSVMTVLAGAAKAVAAREPERALRAMDDVESAGRQALEELRHLLGVLRPEPERDDLGPQPGLSDVPRLVDETRRAGLEVSYTVDALPAVPARVELFAYRIIQEALTNALKHSGPGTQVDLLVGPHLPGVPGTDGRPGIVLEVLDDGRGTPVLTELGPGSRSTGHGVIGMRERARLLGGTLQASPRTGGGFAVVAHLPAEGKHG
jgi:signal transduction histidine kinase